MSFAIRLYPDGRREFVHRDDLAAALPGAGHTRRASRVEPVNGGPFDQCWSVDLSPLGPPFCYSLYPPLPTRGAALDQEHRHLAAAYLPRQPAPERSPHAPRHRRQ